MIEEKISRLAPDQLREVEDFIDFLISRDSNATHGIRNHEGGDNVPRAMDEVAQPAPILFAEEYAVAARTDQDLLPDYPEYGGSGTTGKTREPERLKVAPRRAEKQPDRLLDWID